MVLMIAGPLSHMPFSGTFTKLNRPKGGKRKIPSKTTNQQTPLSKKEDLTSEDQKEPEKGIHAHGDCHA